MLEPTLAIHARGQSPSAHHIDEQRREQLRAIRIYRGVLEGSRQMPRDPCLHLSEARGLPSE